MKVKMPSGVILEHNSPDVYEQLLKVGGKEVVVKATSTKPTKEKVVNKEKEQ